MRTGLLATVATAIILGAALLQGGGGAGLANLWVDTNGGTCTRSGTLVAYVDASACSSFAAAHSASLAGDMVRVKGGTYGTQTLNLDKGASDVVFEEASGESVIVDNNAGTWESTADLNVDPGAGNITLRNISVEWLWSWETTCTGTVTNNITLENIDLGTFFLRNDQNWIIRDSDIGPAESSTTIDAHPLLDDCGSAAGALNLSITIEDSYFHDIYTSDVNSHTECLLVTGVDGLTLRRSRFFNCDSTGAIYVTRWNSADRGEVKNVTIENNFFLNDEGYTTGPCLLAASPCSGTSTTWHIQLENDVQNLLYRNNTSSKRILSLDASDSCAGCGYTEYSVSMKSNYGSMTGGGAWCAGGGNIWIDWDDPLNGIYDSDVCTGETATNAFLEVVNEQTDHHLASGSDAIDAGASSSTASDDIDKQTRPLGAAVDAGADEKQ